jgi:hypothetical protein
LNNLKKDFQKFLVVYEIIEELNQRGKLLSPPIKKLPIFKNLNLVKIIVLFHILDNCEPDNNRKDLNMTLYILKTYKKQIFGKQAFQMWKLF